MYINCRQAERELNEKNRQEEDRKKAADEQLKKDLEEANERKRAAEEQLRKDSEEEHERKHREKKESDRQYEENGRNGGGGDGGGAGGGDSSGGEGRSGDGGGGDGRGGEDRHTIDLPPISPERDGQPLKKDKNNYQWEKDQEVEYYSTTYGDWIKATVQKVHSDGTVTLDVKERADPDQIMAITDPNGMEHPVRHVPAGLDPFGSDDSDDDDLGPRGRSYKRPACTLS